MRTKGHVPRRTCVMCRRTLPKVELTRFACPDAPGQRPEADPAGRLPGRGFYCCSENDCQAGISSYKGWLRHCKGVRHGR